MRRVPAARAAAGQSLHNGRFSLQRLQRRQSLGQFMLCEVQLLKLFAIRVFLKRD